MVSIAIYYDVWHQHKHRVIIVNTNRKVLGVTCYIQLCELRISFDQVSELAVVEKVDRRV